MATAYRASRLHGRVPSEPEALRLTVKTMEACHVHLDAQFYIDMVDRELSHLNANPEMQWRARNDWLRFGWIKGREFRYIANAGVNRTVLPDICTHITNIMLDRSTTRYFLYHPGISLDSGITVVSALD